MPFITIDNVEYNVASLSENAKSQLQMMQVTDQEIERLSVQMAILQTARNAYAKTLKDSLPGQQGS